MIRQTPLTAPEIARTYGVDLLTVQTSWARHPDWPPAAGRHGQWNAYPVGAVEAWVQQHRTRAELPSGDPNELLTVREIAEHAGLAESTIRADISRGRIPRMPDDETDGVKRWRRGTIDAAMRNRRAYRRGR